MNTIFIPFRLNDIARFIKADSKKVYFLDTERIELEEKYYGFYAVATNLIDDSAKDILEINSQRYKIEDCFRVLKTNFNARHVYHRLDNRIIAHVRLFLCQNFSIKLDTIRLTTGYEI